MPTYDQFQDALRSRRQIFPIGQFMPNCPLKLNWPDGPIESFPVREMLWATFGENRPAIWAATGLALDFTVWDWRSLGLWPDKNNFYSGRRLHKTYLAMRVWDPPLGWAYTAEDLDQIAYGTLQDYWDIMADTTGDEFRESEEVPYPLFPSPIISNSAISPLRKGDWLDEFSKMFGNLAFEIRTVEPFEEYLKEKVKMVRIASQLYQQIHFPNSSDHTADITLFLRQWWEWVHCLLPVRQVAHSKFEHPWSKLEHPWNPGEM